MLSHCKDALSHMSHKMGLHNTTSAAFVFARNCLIALGKTISQWILILHTVGTTREPGLFSRTLSLLFVGLRTCL